MLSHPIVTHASTPLSQANTPVLYDDTQLGRKVSSHPVVTQASYTNASPSYDSTPVHYNTPQHSTLTREMPLLQQLPNSQIRQDVARWSKFEQLKAKYLTQDQTVSLQSRLLKHNLT